MHILCSIYNFWFTENNIYWVSSFDTKDMASLVAQTVKNLPAMK